MNNSPHAPVLLQEVIETFSLLKGGALIDCTLGYAGHSFALLESNPNISHIGIDQDSSATLFAAEKLKPFSKRSHIIKGRFSERTKEVLSDKGLEVSGILADIGVSSLQLDEAERGFGFDAPLLDMRMDTSSQLRAYEVVNSYDEERLSQIFFEYGEVINARTLAQKIVTQRKKKLFESASELSSFIKDNFRCKKARKIHPATLPFQAIRIEVNSELEELKALLDAIENANLEQCRVAIISFHSLEDRIVKERFKKWAKSCICDTRALRCTCGNNHNIGRILTKKPIVAKDEEIAMNPRSRSAKMRIFECEQDGR